MENERRVQQKAPAGRYALLDELRGLDLVSMMLYHACWDMMFLFGIWMDWYAGMPGRLWQQTICWVFILLSGFCVQLGHHTLRRGAQVFGAGALVTAVTLLFMPEDRVIFGVLTLLGSAMLLTDLLEKPLRRIPPAAGFAISAVLFALTRNVSAAIWVLAVCASGCRRHSMQTALQRTLAFIRGGSILRIILPFCRGCFCSGQGTFSTAL